LTSGLNLGLPSTSTPTLTDGILIFVIPRLLNYAAAHIAVVHIRLVLEATD
jgi:hypothetical protein